MTTGRINQVSKIQVPGTFAPELESIDELDSCYKSVYRSKSEHKEFYFHHIFQAATDESTNSEEPKHSARNYSTMQQAFYHSLRIDAKLEILQKYKYKLSNTLQFRRTAKFLRRLHSPIRIRLQKRLKD